MDVKAVMVLSRVNSDIVARLYCTATVLYCTVTVLTQCTVLYSAEHQLNLGWIAWVDPD